jgi:hypothetical protein
MPTSDTEPERVRLRYDGPSSMAGQLVDMLDQQGLTVDRSRSGDTKRRSWTPTPEELHVSIVVAKTAVKGAIGGMAGLGAKNVAQRVIDRFNERNKPWNAKAEIEDGEGDI